MRTSDIRQSYLEYFKQHGHKVCDSATLIPADDPSLLFNNAGMVPFKRCFLGERKPPAPRCTSAQRCIRLGGKHNDLENVGHTKRHLTFFEMLGNFSFSDYGKKQAITMAWEFLTRVLQLPKSKLWVTVHHSDDEAYELWQQTVGVESERIIRCGDADNFWSMGDTGPCGPCTEIFYDHGPEVEGGLPGSAEADGDRYVEVWNLVFMQYDKQSSGELLDLPNLCVDTGMGLERIAAVMQGVVSVFETDVFQTIIYAIGQMATQSQLKIKINHKQVIADHLRSIAWLITDQVRPSNEGRGYVLRRVIRRALRYAHTAGLPVPCLYKLVPVVAEFYPELQRSSSVIVSVLEAEEKAFAQTLNQGLQVFEKAVAHLSNQCLSGELVFKLYDTYGFPVDMVMDLAKERGITVDIEGYEKAMLDQKNRSKQHQKFTDQLTSDWQIEHKSLFLGYDQIISEASVLGIWNLQSQSMTSLEDNQQGCFCLHQTPFYAESGGQVGDKGRIVSDSGVFQVEDTQKKDGAFVHYGRMTEGVIKVGDRVKAIVDNSRLDTARNHSATHLLHSVLVKVLGVHVVQKGSLVDDKRLRFDFAHNQSVTKTEWQMIEAQVNAMIRENYPVETTTMAYNEAMDSGVTALFTEKYEDQVRVVAMGEGSKELCGGTHVKATGDIGLFVLIQESAIAQGVRRIEAVTGSQAIKEIQSRQQILWDLLKLQKTSEDQLVISIEALKDDHAFLKKQIEHLELKQLQQTAKTWVDQTVTLKGVDCVFQAIEQSSASVLRKAVDACLQKKDCLVCCWFLVNEKANIAVGVPASWTEKISAKTVFAHINNRLKAKGGGKPVFAQGSCQTMGSVNDFKDQLIAAVNEALPEHE